MRIAPLALVAVLLATACGDGGPELSDREADALAVVADGPLTGGEQRCLLDGLAAADIDPVAVVEGSLDAESDSALLAVTVDCIDDPTRIPAFVASFIEGAAEEGVALTEDEARCAIASLDEAGEAEASTAIAACLTAEEVADTRSYGDDDVLDLLWDGCAEGNNQICDELFAVAPPGTDYADQGRTCAGRLPDSTGFRCFLDLDG